jgi:hypothetical protein
MMFSSEDFTGSTGCSDFLIFSTTVGTSNSKKLSRMLKALKGLHK